MIVFQMDLPFVPSIYGEIWFKRNEIEVIFTVNFWELLCSAIFKYIQVIWENCYHKILNSLKPYQVKIASSSSKAKWESNLLVRSVEWKAPYFNLTLAITETLDLSGV